MRMFEMTRPALPTSIDLYVKSLGGQSVSMGKSGRLVVTGSLKFPLSTRKVEAAFESVHGDFDCSGTSITSLSGAPQYVGGSFYCYDCESIASLEGGPQFVSRHVYVNNTSLATLKGAPHTVGGTFSCHSTPLTSLEGAPQTVGGSVSCHSTKITSLIGMPQSIRYDVYCQTATLTSLKGIHKTHRNWKVGGTIHLPMHCADIVGLALIEGISRVDINDAEFDISDHDPHAFQEKLLDAGLKAQARM